MASNPNDGGFICPPRLIELAGSTGYLKSDEGGEELRQYYDAILDECIPERFSNFAFDCFFGLKARLVEHFEHGRAPRLDESVTPFKLSYAAIIVFGAQRGGSTVFQMDHVGSLELLIAKGAPVGSADIAGVTPIHMASADKGKPELLQVLLAHGAPVDARDKYGRTPLFDALKSGEAACVEILLEAGANSDLMDADGVRPENIYGGPAVAAVLQRWKRKETGERAAFDKGKKCDYCEIELKQQLWCARCHTAWYCSRECQKLAWRNHKPNCSIFLGPTAYRLRPVYLSQGYTTNMTTQSLQRDWMGLSPKPDPNHMVEKGPQEETDQDRTYPKSMIIKVQLPYGGHGDMMVYNRKRDFQARLNSSSGSKGYVALQKEIKERGAMGLKGYFSAELKSRDELIVKVEVVASQDW